MRTIILCCLGCLIMMAGCESSDKLQQVEQWGLFEITLAGPEEGNPYMEVDLWATFVCGEDSLHIPGFYNGEGTYLVRFSPPEQGQWEYVTESNAGSLDGREGAFSCIPPGGNNHGPLKIVNTYYLQYADGTPFYSVGTTAYQWTSVKQSIQEQTVETLAEAPFNKIRMCVFPKHYRYGNDTEPWMHPFERTGDSTDFTRPQYAFFRNFDRRVGQLSELGIEADVILFHPYDIWGYYLMGDELNERYVRYMIARLSAYRNVWWSLANEWDIPAIKVAIDWEAVGNQLMKEDGHQRFRGIHNWYDTEAHFYDHSRPWITHTCTQTSRFWDAIRWREMYRKPLLFDEMRYEGDVDSGWGNMSGEEMCSYFWMAGLSGGYPTHGETYVNPSDDSTEVRWWGKGGSLVGSSVPRIAYFRNIMEAAPLTEMTPVIDTQEDPGNKRNNIHVFRKEGMYYMAYVAGAGEEITLELPGGEGYELEVHDTWNMRLTDRRELEPGVFSYVTERPYTLLIVMAR